MNMIRTLIHRLLPEALLGWLRALRAERIRQRRLAAVPAPVSKLRAGADGKRVLFFAPEAGLEPYIDVLSFVARTLQERGHRPLYLRCFDLFPRCSVKDNHLMRESVSRGAMLDSCLDCVAQSQRFVQDRGLDYLDLREVLDAQTIESHRALVAEVADDNLLELDHRGVNVGRLAYYDFALSIKHSLHDGLDAARSGLFREYILSSVLAIECFVALNAKYPIDSIVAFDAYGMATSVKVYAKSLGIPSRLMTVPYHLNGDWRRVVGMADYSIVYEQRFRAGYWSQFKDVPLPANYLQEIMNDLIFRMTGSGAHIYSANKSTAADQLSQELGLRADRKTIVAYTSSRDEHDAILVSLKGMGYPAETIDDAFGDTFEWLDALIEHVRSRDDLQLLIRIHPRVGATRRDGKASRDAAEYRRCYSDGLPENVRMIWYDQAVSSYDLAELADLALVSWSSMGLELARMGIPVLSGLRSVLTLAPDDARFLRQSNSRDDYFQQLESLLAEPPSANDCLLAYRWYNLFYLGNSIDLSDVRPAAAPGAADSAAYQLPARAALLEKLFVNQNEVVTDFLADLRGPAPDSAGEIQAFAGQLGRLLHFLFSGEDLRVARKLLVRTEPVATAELQPGELGARLDAQSGRVVSVAYNDGQAIRERHSVLFLRLFEIVRQLSQEAVGTGEVQRNA